MSELNNLHRRPARTTYRVENRQFNVSRSFGSQKTVSQLLTEELSSGLLRLRN